MNNIESNKKALDKLASVLGFMRAPEPVNEFWYCPDAKGDILARLVCLEGEISELRVKCYRLERQVAGKRDKRARIF